MTISASTWMGDHQRRSGAANLGPFIGLDMNMLPIIFKIAISADTK